MKKYIVSAKEETVTLNITQAEMPTPRSTEVLVKWYATSLNYHDYLVAIGAIPVSENRIPMSDGAGIVEAVGDQVTTWKPGDKVMSLFFPNWHNGEASLSAISQISGETCDGYMTEYSCLDENQVTAIPEGYTYEEAATLPCAGLTAWNALMHPSPITSGEKVLIEGTGGMSLLALQVALAGGAQVYATTSLQAKAEKLLSLGVQKVYNYREDERWGRTIYKETGGMDRILDVGGGSTMGQSIEAAKVNGHIVSIGILGNGRKGTITFPKLFFKFLTLRGIAVGSRSMQEAMVEFINQHNVKPIIDNKKFTFEELKEAFSYQNSGQQFGKIVITYS